MIPNGPVPGGRFVRSSHKKDVPVLEDAESMITTVLVRSASKAVHSP